MCQHCPTQPVPSAFRIPHHRAAGLIDDSFEPDDLPTAPELAPVKLEKTGIKRQKQGELASPEEIWAETISTKLRLAGKLALAEAVRKCCTTWTIRTCLNCLDHQSFPNHCDNLICPKCSGRILKRRKTQIEWWTKFVRQPKHVVLTVRNSDYLSSEYLAAVKLAFRQLRHSKFARNWRGGCWSLEITNEGRGWHVHLHCLIDATWIDSRQLAAEWAKRVHQDFAIVKVKDCRNAEYLQEVCKYVAKGSEVATWSAEEISCFVDALTSQRTFGIFGTLHGQLQAWKDACDTAAERIHECECCGHREFQFLPESEFVWRQTINGFL